MRAEIYHPDDPTTTLAVAIWSDGRTSLEVMDASAETAQKLEGLLRPVPVVVDDASLRRLGTHGETLLEPGSHVWFRTALVQRAGAAGLSVRFVAGEIVGGWDPAATYRTFDEQIDRLASG